MLIVEAAAHASNSLLDFLACTAVTAVDDVRTVQIPEQLVRARRALEVTSRRSTALPGAVTEILLGRRSGHRLGAASADIRGFEGTAARSRLRIPGCCPVRPWG
ncbi:hypothetical protein ACWEN4_27510 [Streptomyces violaceorubidus]